MTGTALMHTNTVPRLIALPGVYRPQADTRLLASALALRGSADLCGGGHGRGPRRNGPGRRDYCPLRPFHGRRVHVPPQPYVPWCNTSRRSPRESQGERRGTRSGEDRSRAVRNRARASVPPCPWRNGRADRAAWPPRRAGRRPAPELLGASSALRACRGIVLDGALVRRLELPGTGPLLVDGPRRRSPFARAVLSPRFSALSLMCSYWRSRVASGPRGMITRSGDTAHGAPTRGHGPHSSPVPASPEGQKSGQFATYCSPPPP